MPPISACSTFRSARALYELQLPFSQIQLSHQHLRNLRAYSSTENLPRVARPSIWHSIIPKAFRNSDSSNVTTKIHGRKDWNPATFFIWIFLLIGSNAIQMITLRNEYSSLSRKADAKIKLLKEVLDKVQRGEKVDVEKVLGTGDPEQEQEWHDVIQNIEEEDRLWQLNDRKSQKRRLRKEQAAAGSPPENELATAGDEESEKPTSSTVKIKRPPGFY